MTLADVARYAPDNPVVKTGLITVAGMAAVQIVLYFAAGDAWATAYLWSVASFASGALLGFLFGVPKVLQDETTKNAGGPRQLVNTNLDQISDWLTKVVVGLTLVNARDISTSLKGTAGILATALGNKDTDLALAMAVIVYFSVLGFMSLYILTRLYLSAAFWEREQASKDSTAISGAKSAEEGKAEAGKPMADRSRWFAALGRWFGRFNPVTWFEKRSLPVQVALIVALVVLVAIYLGALKDLATLVRTIGEVWRGK